MADHRLTVWLLVVALLPPGALWQIEFEQPGRFEPAEIGPRVPLSDQELELPELEEDGPGGPPDPSEPDVPVPEPSDGSGGIVARDDAAQTPSGVLVRINYTENDRYDGSVRLTAITEPRVGEVTSAGAPDPHFLYTPDEDLPPDTIDEFEYTVCRSDAADDCDSASVTVTIADPTDMVPERADGVVAERGGGGRTAPAACQEPLEWGGHGNGEIPDAAMRSIGDGHRLKREAAAAFELMHAAAAAEGVTIGLTDSYRSFAAQKEVRERKGHLVATAEPGTSVHGWGKALDLNVRPPGVQAWLERHSRDYAWINPPWAKRPGKSFEPWHYEFYGTNVNPDNPQCAGIGMALTSANGAASEAAAGPTTGHVLPMTAIRPLGLGVGALAALALAAGIVVRDVRRGRGVRERPPP